MLNQVCIVGICPEPWWVIFVRHNWLSITVSFVFDLFCLIASFMRNHAMLREWLKDSVSVWGSHCSKNRVDNLMDSLVTNRNYVCTVCFSSWDYNTEACVAAHCKLVCYTYIQMNIKSAQKILVCSATCLSPLPEQHGMNSLMNGMNNHWMNSPWCE